MKLKTERSCRVTAFSFAASVLCSTAMGAVYDASTGYVTMTKSDNAPWPAANGQAFKSFDADGALETAWGVIGHRWSDGEYTHSGTNYYAQYNMYAHGVSGTPVPFKGDSLIVGAKLTYSGSSGMKMAFNDRTVFGAGASFLWSSVGHVLGGAVTLEGTDERPNRFEHTRRSSGEYTVQFTPAPKGAGKAEFKYTDDTVANSINTSVNIKDATAIQKHIAILENLTDTGLILADVDVDADVNIKDATAIQKHIAGMETGYSIGQPVMD